MAKKKKKKALPIILLIALLGGLIVAYVFVSDYKEKQEQEEMDLGEAEKKATAYPAFDTGEITKLTLTNESGEQTLLYDGTTWVMEGEEAFPLDQDRLNTVAEYLADLNISKVLQDVENIQEYGLDQQRNSATITKKDGSIVKVVLGDLLSAGSEYYCMVNNDSKMVYTIDSLLFTYTNFGRGDLLLSETLPEIDTETIKEVKITSEEYGNLTLVYQEGNKLDFSGLNVFPWVISEPYPKEKSGDSDVIAEYLAVFSDMSLMGAVDYRREAFKEYGLIQPSSVLSLFYQEESASETEGEEPVLQDAKRTVYFGDRDENGNVYVRFDDSDYVYRMAGSKAEGLLAHNTDSLLSPLHHLIGIETVSKLEVLADGTKHVYTFEFKTEKNKEGKEEKLSKFTADGTAIVENQDKMRSLYQEMVGIKSVGNLEKETVFEEAPLLKMVFYRNSPDLETIEVEYLPYTKDYNAMRINGVTEMYADARDIQTILKQIEEFSPK